MNDIEQKIHDWQYQGKKTTIATVVKIYGSAPQPLGSKMVVNEDLAFAGSVSGGCVEGDVIDQARRIISKPNHKLMVYGISDETAWGVGLSCGGTIEVFLEPYQDIHTTIFQLQQEKQLFAVLTILSGKRIGEKQVIKPEDLINVDMSGFLENPQIRDLVSRALQFQKPEKADIVLEGEESQVFCEVYSPPARLIIIGGSHIAIPLVEFAHVLNFTTIVVDARSPFASTERFPFADQIIVEWPSEALEKLKIDENTFIAFISHDDKFDIPALQVALTSKARYIGVLGSRKTHANRINMLLEVGASPESLNRIHAPIGLDIGASGAPEIALSIMAEIIAVRNGKSLPGKS